MTRVIPIGDLPLSGGGVLRGAELASITYGTLAPGGRNAILLTHGYTSSHLFADGGPAASEGSWAALVGPGRAIDTERYFVVSSNMLGSAFGSTAPRSMNPATGRPYGPDFPAITLADIVNAQRRLLDILGVNELIAVVGPSYGGFQAFTWATLHPGFMRGIVPTVTGLRAPGSDIAALEARFASDPNWNAGHYYALPGGIDATMASIRAETLRRYGLDASEAEIDRLALAWARQFDAHSLLTLGRAANAYDARRELHKARAKVLYVLSSTDALFPPSLAQPTMGALAQAGLDAAYVQIDGPHGHLASGTDAAKWAGSLAGFLRELA